MRTSVIVLPERWPRVQFRRRYDTQPTQRNAVRDEDDIQSVERIRMALNE
jgi:hypothetical protein